MKKIILSLFLFSLILAPCAFADIWGGGTPPAVVQKGLPKTGQLTSYVDYDDGYYQKGLPLSGNRFTDNSDGTITDNATGLQWAKDGNGAGCNNGGTLAWAAAISFCKNLNFAGHTDWRLPNVKELQSIVDYELVYPAINQTFFPNTQSDYYWSGTTYADSTGYAWFVDFYGGYVSYDDRGSGYYVRPVRSSQ